MMNIITNCTLISRYQSTVPFEDLVVSWTGDKRMFGGNESLETVLWKRILVSLVSLSKDLSGVSIFLASFLPNKNNTYRSIELELYVIWELFICQRNCYVVTIHKYIFTKFSLAKKT